VWKLCMVAVAVATAAVGDRAAAAVGSRNCPVRAQSVTYARSVERALASGRDVWGEALLAAPGGPTFARANRILNPLLLAGHVPGRRSTPLTDSGVYYLPFGLPPGTTRVDPVSLHLADGSEIVFGSVAGPRVRVDVGPDGKERYGSCLARLATPSLAGGYLPVLETRYVDAAGARYTQESFTGRASQSEPPSAFIRLSVDARRESHAHIFVRLTASSGSSLAREVRQGTRETLYVSWRPGASPAVVDRAVYMRALRNLVASWQRRLAAGATFDVPEQVVEDAVRAKLVQNLTMGWRYSIGNPYEEFEYPESLDAASVMGEYGYGQEELSALEASLSRQPTLYPNWEMGAKLLTSALYYRLYRDRVFIARATPTLRGYTNALAHELAGNRLGLLDRERWTSDLSETGYGLDGQAVVWQALRAIGSVWSRVGDAAAARQAFSLADRLGRGLRRALRRSERRLSDGSLYVPIKLDSGERPTRDVLQTRDGSYWNYELPYALASGLFPPGSAAAMGALRYEERHGSLLLGQLRINAYSLYANPRFPTSGTDDVYILNLARFLADNDQADRLVLSLYGQLAAGMTPGTFVAGEAASVAPVDGAYYRTMYLPPNSVANASFLETLRLMLVHELDGVGGRPEGLALAYSTPRSWLKPGRTIRVQDASTPFGRLSYAIHTLARAVDVSLTVPDSPPPRIVRLRLRLPGRRPLRSVTVNGHRYNAYDATAETINLDDQTGALTLIVRY
jgi:hypothetical protein